MLLAVAALYWDRRDKLEALLGADGEVMAFVHQPDSWPPSYAVLRTGNTYALAMAGTTNIAPQVPGHIKGTFARQAPLEGCQVHGQWLQAWEEVWALVRPLLPNDLAGADLRLAGHSYGGALAQIGALLLAAEPQPPAVSVLTLGSARGVTEGYAGPVPTMWHLYSDGDPVFKLPVNLSEVPFTFHWVIPLVWRAFMPRWKHYGTSIPLGPGGRLGPGEAPPDPLPPNVSLFPVGQHSCVNYQGRLAAWLANSSGDAHMAQALGLTLEVISGAPVQAVVPGLPRLVPGPDGGLVPVPDYDGVYRPVARRSAMAFPIELTGGFPFRVTRYVNLLENGFTNSYILYVFGNNFSNAYDVALGHTGAVNEMYRNFLTSSTAIVGTKVGLDTDKHTSDLYTLGDGVGLGYGKLAKATSQARVVWALRILSTAGGAKGTWEVSGLPSEDTNITTVGVTKLTKAASSRINTLVNNLEGLFVAAPNSNTVAGYNAVGAMRVINTNPVINVPVPVSEFSLTENGYLRVAVPSVLPGIELGSRLKLAVNRSKCTIGLSGTYRVINLSDSGPPFLYTLLKRFCCPLDSLATITGWVQPVRYIYTPIGSISAKWISTRDRGPAFFAGRGRQRARCC
jgi:hypothetical protein